MVLIPYGDCNRIGCMAPQSYGSFGSHLMVRRSLVLGMFRVSGSCSIVLFECCLAVCRRHHDKCFFAFGGLRFVHRHGAQGPSVEVGKLNGAASSGNCAMHYGAFRDSSWSSCSASF